MVSRLLSLVVVGIYLLMAYWARQRYEPMVWGRFFLLTWVGLCLIWAANALGGAGDSQDGTSEKAAACIGWLFLLAPAVIMLLVYGILGPILEGVRPVR